MTKFFEKIIKRKKLVIIIFAILAVFCGVLMLGVSQNYDMSKYLPGDSQAKMGIEVLKNEYSYNGNAVALIEQKSIVEILEIKEQIEQVDGIEKVIWLDDVTDIKQPVEIIDEEILNNYLINDDALLNIIFANDDNSEQTREAIDELKAMFGEDIMLSGSAIEAYENINQLSGNIMTNILLAVAVFLVILALATNSFLEVPLILITIGVAILLNMGTNVIFGEISNITFATAAILQLAISMDYSIILLHRFEYERETESSPVKAMVKALKASMSSIMSSGLTTIVGFLALVFMSYTIGMDMGLVLAKGIVFSLLCVMTLLPALTVFLVKWIDKTKHKKMLPSMKRVEHLLSGKIKYILVILLLVIAGVSFMAQSNNTFTYSGGSGAGPEQQAIDEKIADKFGVSNSFVILVPRGNGAAEYEMANEMESLPFVRSVQGYYALISPAMPQEIIPKEVKDNFFSENYSRYIVEVDAEIESDESFAAVEQIRQIVSTHFDESYVTGASPIVYDIKQAASGDFSMVSILSIILVGIILLIAFKSISLPIILLLIIETSIWINMSIPYFQGVSMIFLGYMIISAVQLGATIDYTILMTNYYLEGRQTLNKREAGEYASDKAGASILVSALVLAVAGFTLALTFTQDSLAQLGILIGRGAFLSGFLTIVVLPQVLILLDKFVSKTTLKRKLFKRGKTNEI